MEHANLSGPAAGHAPAAMLQRACRSAAQCAVASAGDAGTFGATVEAESNQIAIDSGGVAEEHNVASRLDENILGNIKDIQCVCNCDTTDKFVEAVFKDASDVWPAATREEEKTEFKRAMTGFIPSFWPRSLHVK
ncbi:MAG TPA: hypothetical protein VGO59_08460 [Verrucomicrobiae bacterium]|jgi:hypothetical protein